MSLVGVVHGGALVVIINKETITDRWYTINGQPMTAPYLS